MSRIRFRNTAWDVPPGISNVEFPLFSSIDGRRLHLCALAHATVTSFRVLQPMSNLAQEIAAAAREAAGIATFQLSMGLSVALPNELSADLFFLLLNNEELQFSLRSRAGRVA